MPGLATLEGKVAVVTGGARGIGRGVAEALIARGAEVVIGGIGKENTLATATEIGAVGVVADVTRIDDMRALADETLHRFGRIDILCNNAGVGPSGRVEDMTLDDWKFIIDVNLWGVIHGIDVFLPHLLANPDGACLVNMASFGGLVSLPGVAGYNATKFAVVAISEALAAELAADHPKVNVVIACPGSVKTDINTSNRNRPAALGNIGARDIPLEDTASPSGGAVDINWMEPRQVGEAVADAIVEGRLYLVTHPELFALIRDRHAAIAAAHGA